MSNKVRQVDFTSPRYIDPSAPVGKQLAVLEDLVKNPPENSRIITFTPPLCQEILDTRNTNNRKRKPARIKRYGEAMANEAWVLSGDTIKFGKSGLLLDGQNRLRACVRSGVKFRTHVVFGIDDQAFIVIDSGKTRTIGDTVFTAGVKYPEIAAPCVRWLMIYEDNPTNRGASFSNQELLQFYRTRLDQDQVELAAQRASAVKGIPRGNLAAHLYLFERKHGPTAKRFSDDLAKGQRAGRKLPDKLHRLRAQNMGRLHEVQVNALIIQAWNAYRAGETLSAKHLNWNENREYPAIA